MELVSDRKIEQIYAEAKARRIIDEDDTSVIFYDLSILDDRLDRLVRAFPDASLHAIPIKTNPLIGILRYMVSRGFGLEAASMGEMRLALEAQVAQDRLVFDSPVKTRSEIEFLASHAPGVRINADSLDELQLYPRENCGFRLGIRVNPGIAAKSVKSMNVGDTDSKFGVPISASDDIIGACLEYEAIDCLHVHIGSQCQDLGPNIESIASIVKLAEKVNAAAGFRKITHLDIGGGFPVDYSGGNSYRIEDYTAELKSTCPRLFDSSFRPVTEFGRYVHANAGWAAVQIEYVKATSNASTLLTHAGADMFLRESYNPAEWQHQCLVLDRQGQISDQKPVNTHLAGPLCFGGDFFGKDMPLPAARTGDTVIVRDIGANTFALWSRHCSRPFPKVVTYRGGSEEPAFQVIRERESYEDIIRFWS